MGAGEQIAVIILGGIGLFALRWLFAWGIQALAKAIVKSINGQLGLNELRNDVSELKRQFEQILIDLN